jgi:hypothetical protein
MAREATAEVLTATEPNDSVETTALAHRDEQGDQVATNPMQMIQYALRHGVEPATLKEMMDLASGWQDREAARVFGERFAEFQAALPQIEKKRTVNTKQGDRMYNFAAMEDVDREVQPIKARFGLSTSGTIKAEPAGIHVEWTLQIGSHRERKEYVLPAIAPGGLLQGGANATQNLGAWMSYIRRYTYCLALGVVVRDEDTDANSMADLLLITKAQRKELDELIEQERMDEKRVQKLLVWVGAESLDKITQPQFRKIATTYRKKKQPEEQKAGAA